jgi:glutathione-specific gamma-glutamylcyclotransferase
MESDIWVFGYGSLIWRPDIEYLEVRVVRLDGWMRRFWQGSHDHRGVPQAPGRVVTLLQRPGESCGGVAYRISATVAASVFAELDYREKNGYVRRDVQLQCVDGNEFAAIVYIATERNFAYLGPAPAAQIAAQIVASAGPSGRNIDYLLELAQALRKLDLEDPHVSELEQLVLDATA